MLLGCTSYSLVQTVFLCSVSSLAVRSAKNSLILLLIDNKYKQLVICANIYFKRLNGPSFPQLIWFWL